MAQKQAAEGLPSSVTDLNEDSLFKLQCLIKAPDIRHSVQCQFRRAQILAFTTGNADIILYYKRDAASSAVIKRVLWFQGSHKQISALSFNPLGSWLLCATVDGSLYVVPALFLVDEKYNVAVDDKWSIHDVTALPFAGKHSSFSRPTAVVWWEDGPTAVNMAIVGTEYGEIVLINLDNGKHVALAHVNGNVADLHICKDEDNRNLTLLITSEARQQWRLLLEGQTYSCLRQLDNSESYTIIRHPPETIHDNAKTFTSTRSRLQGLKQLSIEKLAILRQKSVETRNQGFGDSPKHYDVGSNGNNNSVTVGSQQSSILNSNRAMPEPISRETFLTCQSNEFVRKQQLYTCYHSSTNCLTVHGPDISAVPLSVHKVLQSSGDVLLTQRFFFITDDTQYTLYIISDRLSETRSNKDSDFDPECIIGHFCFDSGKEMIRAVYRASEFKSVTPRKLSEATESEYVASTGMKDLDDGSPCIDTCLVVTNRSVYKIVLRKSLLTVFMDLALEQNDFKKAGKLAFVFGMNAQQLLECAGDILLSNKQFPRAVAAYKLSKCKLFKTVLKFASTGHTSELLSCLTYSLVSPRISELPVAARIHLSNLCVLAFIEMTFRATSLQSKAIYKDFLYFLSTNTFYDELLVVNIAGQTCLWEVLHRLATQRGLYEQMLDVLMKTVCTPGTENSYPMPCGLLICLSEPNLMQAMLINPSLARSHMCFVIDNLSEFQVFVLQRLVTLYDPTNPVLRPRMMHCKARHRTTSYSSQSSQCDSIDLTDNDESDTLVEEILETFLLILLTLIYKKGLISQEPLYTYGIQSVLPVKKDHTDVSSNVDFRRRAISAGFSHVALIRNADIYTWGNSVHGCLGTGPSVLRFGLPHAISFFRNMKVEVLSVSCGHSHTLAVTNNGIYAWGASQYGQLGLGKILQCSGPEFISSLAQEVIIDAVAGQYHSVALTVDGRIFTWGWGVHGQLGHGSTEERSTPTLVTSLLGVVVKHVSAGHAHTLALSAEGVVYAFGCNVFGQLGVGTNIKSSIPIRVLLPERVSLIATGYFHNLAIGNTNKLYAWGASPQVLKLQAQAQKKTRYLEQQDMMERRAPQRCEEAAKDNHAVSTVKEEGTPVTNVQSERAHVKVNANGTEARRRHHDGIKLNNVNVGLLEETLTHLTPSVVDTSSVKNQIIQISTGCHHNAILTKDGSLYTWGRNTDGQIGNGTRREELIPTPLCYNPASIFAQVPPRHSNCRRATAEEEQNCSVRAKCSVVADGKNGNASGEVCSDKADSENISHRENVNPVIKAVGVCCGYDYTVAIQPDGRILAWGNNSKAQLGRLPVKDTRDGEDKLVIVKPSKRILRFPHASHMALDIPNRVPDISAPIISYQSYDVPSLAGLIQPLSVIEKSPGDLTLHYVLDHFSGLYDYGKIMEKSVELRNYQACSKVARLQQNIYDAFTYELERLNAFSLCSSTARHDQEPNLMRKQYASTTMQDNLKRNTELFNRQVEKNLIESMVDCAARNRLKIPASKSLNSLQTVDQELHSFDCQGGSEELCKDPKCDDTSLEIVEDVLDAEFNTVRSEEWIDNVTSSDDASRDNENVIDVTIQLSRSVRTKMGTNLDPITEAQQSRSSMTNNMTSYEKETVYSQANNLTNETIKVIKFYLGEMENDTDTVKYKILRNALEFWIEQNLPPQSLENVFLEHVDNIFYPLGLLLFCQEIVERYLDTGKCDAVEENLYVTNIFSVKFCLQITSKLLRHIEQGQPTPEYIKLLSCLTADQYGPPLTGYPGSTGNNTSKEMVDGIISTISSESQDSRSFVHIKDPDAVYRFLAVEEDTMVFTCGHHFPVPAYQSELIPGMETELLTTQSLLLPCTAQFLGKMLCETSMPEIVCPLCIPRALGTVVKKSKG